MDLNPSQQIPILPKLRPLDYQWVDYQGQRMLYPRDPLSMTEGTTLIPQMLAPLLALCDGTRDLAGLKSALAMRTGVQLSVEEITNVIRNLDQSFLLENGAYKRAITETMQRYHDAPHRLPSHADQVYPADLKKLAKTFREYAATVPPDFEALATETNLVGMLCPHIDYARGHETYAQLWHRAAPALEDIELTIILGTDHYGGLGTITPTRQSYATPYGVMPTDREIVDGLVDVLGERAAFAEEMHHLTEHSIELASVWFHHYNKKKDCPVVPLLCGSFHQFVVDDTSPEEEDNIRGTIEYLRGIMSQRKTLVIAAADLAHVGPAFGDSEPMDTEAFEKLAADDKESMTEICNGDADAFLQRSQKEDDARKICGLSPIYIMLKLLGDSRGEWFAYNQCPADQQNGSVVSIAGALLFGD